MVEVTRVERKATDGLVSYLRVGGWGRALNIYEAADLIETQAATIEKLEAEVARLRGKHRSKDDGTT